MTPSELSRFLENWDQASKVKRLKILSNFLNDHDGKTAAELELVLSNCASLFFTRLTAWLRLSYLNAASIQIQLKSLLLFLNASNGQNFLAEFIEVGGILTLLEVLGLPNLNEDDKAFALKLIFIIASKGRKHKELICESFGIRAVAECLSQSKDMDCRDECKIVLKELSTGNPKYQQQVYKAMIALLKSASAYAQQIAAQLLQYVLPMMDGPNIAIIQPCLLLLRSLHIEVQYEGCQLIKLLINYNNIQKDVLSALVQLLQPTKLEMQNQPEIVLDPNGPEIQAPYPVYIQQAVAAKLIGMLSREFTTIEDSFIRLGCIRYLLLAMGNDKHPDSQKQAGLTLQYFIHSYPEVEMRVRDALGQPFFFAYMNEPESFYLKMTPIQVDILTANQVDIKLNDNYEKGT